jgi:NAD(P)-dependent dehydrogenase (short-subunit alcohol dehydrogenase family)
MTVPFSPGPLPGPLATAARFPDLQGASVFVTGGGSGIGATLVEGFADQGARVAFVDIQDSTAFAREVAERTGADVLFLPCDITDIAALEAAMDRAAQAHGPIRVLVNNAANDLRHDPATVTPEEWDASIAVNLRPVLFASRKAAAGMTGGGAIVSFTSISNHIGMPDLAPYVAAKAGIIGLTRSLARAFGPQGVRVNAIAPGWVLTEKQRRLWITPEILEAFLARQAMAQELNPEDMIGPTLFLASDASRMVTGQVLAVDAGVVALG